MFTECFVESIPQFHLVWILKLIVGPPELGGLEIEDMILYYLSFAAFWISLVSASLGMSRILMNGPSKFMKKSKICSGWGFVLLNLSILGGIYSKTAWISNPYAYLGNYSGIEGFELPVPSAIILIWVCTSFIPQCLLVRKCSDFFKSFQF